MSFVVIQRHYAATNVTTSASLNRRHFIPDHIVTGQNGIGQNGTDKMVRQNGTDKMVATFIDSNST